MRGFGVNKSLYVVREWANAKRFHSASGRNSHREPSERIRRCLQEIYRMRRKSRNLRKDVLYVPVPESMKWLDTPTVPMILTVVGTAIFAKILMMIDKSRAQEKLEKRMEKAPPGQGTLRMLTREEWDEIQEMRPRTPFESTLARPGARIRTDEPVSPGDIKDWSIDVLSDAFLRIEETVRRRS